ncbi:hypothetical protein A3J15_02440 [Candidatus Roizmanbacteria bacterium RIFCSPLOWO2_02_FULL_38_10]|uniref:Uncharacterized protein n=1 Tax=Candidatus Roizmanbacteria bacterium RIFCSPLOWO2_02_FULL_38_10 TaxID=1802074 RepID=A0A1F7JNA3_9BACT|nr:MAG: hypothetical protein A3J15_02440 [Candidatus Roizmanbacteria bacterium RIFCSPLOWO2_02_FULL_38_10]
MLNYTDKLPILIYMTLTELNYYVRKFAPFAAIGFLAFVVFYFLIMAVLSSLSRSQPTTPIYNPIFGKISKMKTSASIDYPSNASFSLDTIEGKPISASDSAKVYFIPSKPVRFGYTQTSTLIAKTLDFDTDVVKYKTSPDDPTWISFTDEEKALKIDISNFNFEYKLNYENNPDIFNGSVLPSDDVIYENARQFLRAINRYPDELVRGRQEIIYLQFEPTINDFIVVKTPEEANLAEVDFFRSDIDGNPLLPPKYFSSQNYVVMIFRDQNYKVIKSQIKQYDFDKQNFGIYPIKNGDEAFAELTSGKGIIVSSGKNSNQISINKLLFGYYDPDEIQDYLQPIYVFLGKNGFAAYVPAVRNEYLE